MTTLTTAEKYAQADVVDFWKALSREGLQRCEQAMISRYFPPQGRLLDVGCGAGRAMFTLNRTGYQVTGLDLSLSMLAAGRSLAADAPFSGADVLNLPLADGSFAGVFMFFGALQHLPGRANRRQAIAEMARVTRPEGRLILGLDNIAPALVCYLYWVSQKLRRERRPGAAADPANGADSTLWQRQHRQVNPLVWHTRGLARTLRWRTWTGLVDVARQLGPDTNGLEPGDTQVAQFGVPPTPGYIYYHLYRAQELIEDAAAAGWHLLGQHSGSELTAGQVYPAAVRRRDKQLFFAFVRR